MIHFSLKTLIAFDTSTGKLCSAIFGGKNSLLGNVIKGKKPNELQGKKAVAICQNYLVLEGILVRDVWDAFLSGNLAALSLFFHIFIPELPSQWGLSESNCNLPVFYIPFPFFVF